MSDPLSETFKLLGRGIMWLAARPERVAFVHSGLRNINEIYSLSRDLKRRRAEILDKDKVSAATDVIGDVLDADQVTALQRVWEGVLASPAAESDRPPSDQAELSSPLTDGQIKIVIEGAEALARYSAISQMLNEITPTAETNTSAEWATRRFLFAIALFFVYLAAMTGIETGIPNSDVNEVDDWDQHVGAAAFLAQAVYLAHMAKKDKS